MFVQVIEGAVTDIGDARAELDRCAEVLRAQVPHWLGTTAGVTDDGTLVAVVRFASDHAAGRDSDRPQESQWWVEASRLFAGEVRFDDYAEVLGVRGGGSDDAGFVQVMRGRVSDVGRERKITERFDAAARDVRPDILGGIVALAPDGRFTQAFYFTSEESARAGEQTELPPPLRELFEEEQTLMTEVRFLDLRDPWLYSPG